MVCLYFSLANDNKTYLCDADMLPPSDCFWEDVFCVIYQVVR